MEVVNKKSPPPVAPKPLKAAERPKLKNASMEDSKFNSINSYICASTFPSGSSSSIHTP